MPADSNLNNIPPSPIDNDDLWLINREDRSYKVTSKMLGGYLLGNPIPEICEDDTDCPPDRLCVDGYCERIPCDSEKPPGQEGCPPDYVCIADYCYPTCDIVTGCGEGYVCVDPGVTGGDTICLPYPFPCRPDILPGDGCPPGYVCWGGNCWQTCSGPGGCPPGMDCVETPTNEGVGYICVPSGGGFPCSEGVCPIGYECFFGMCFEACTPGGGGCEEGFTCVTTDIGDFCVPYPFPCDLYGSGCPDGMMCYNGECYPTCDPNGAPCADGFNCLDIGSGNNICFPEVPQEGFVNDGPLVIRTEPLDFPASPAHEKIIFTANQFGRSVLTFKGFDFLPGGPGGGDCNTNTNCPPGFECVGGVCVLTPCKNDGDCSHPDFNMSCTNGFCFPTCPNGDDDLCPNGYECVDGVCIPGGQWPGGTCNRTPDCPSGYECVGGICVPKGCSINSDCGPGMVCYNGYCYSECSFDQGCPDNHVCVTVGGDSFCMPIGGGPDGGGSGGDINIIIDPDWWDPDKNPNSPIGNGQLKVSHSDYFKVGTANGGSYTYFANQKGDTKPNLDINIDKWDPTKNPSSPIKNGRLRISQGNGVALSNNPTDFYANQSGNSSVTVSAKVKNNGGLNLDSNGISVNDTYINGLINAKVKNGQINVNAGNGCSVSGTNATANQSANTTRTVAVKAKTNGGINVDGNGVSINDSYINGLINNIVNNTVKNGQINVAGGNGISATGNNATANQGGNTTRTLSVKAANSSINVGSNGISVNWNDAPNAGGGGTTGGTPATAWCAFQNGGTPLRQSGVASKENHNGANYIKYYNLTTSVGLNACVVYSGPQKSGDQATGSWGIMKTASKVVVRIDTAPFNGMYLDDPAFPGYYSFAVFS